jgi:hypothetical protein
MILVTGGAVRLYPVPLDASVQKISLVAVLYLRERFGPELLCWGLFMSTGHVTRQNVKVALTKISPPQNPLNNFDRNESSTSLDHFKATLDKTSFSVSPLGLRSHHGVDPTVLREFCVVLKE